MCMCVGGGGSKKCYSVLPLCQHVSLLFVDGAARGRVWICFVMTSALASLITTLQQNYIFMITKSLSK